MEDNKPVEVITEVAAPITEAIANETSVQPTQQAQVETAPVETKKEPSESFRYMREQLERERQEREALARRNAELEYAARFQQKSPEPEEDLDAVTLPGEYDSIEAKHLAEMERKNKLRWTREAEKRAQLEMELKRLDAENRLLAEVPNYREILTKENIQKLEEEMPTLARTIAKNTDPYELRKATIDAIQKLVLTNNSVKEKEAQIKAQTEKINKNLEKPLPSASGISSTTSSPLSKANAFSGGLNQAAKDEIWKEWNRKMGNNFISGK